MYDQDAGQRHGADEIQIEKTLLFDWVSPLLFLQSVLDKPSQLLCHIGGPGGGGFVDVQDICAGHCLRRRLKRRCIRTVFLRRQRQPPRIQLGFTFRDSVRDRLRWE